jgi:hypothetical protein
MVGTPDTTVDFDSKTELDFRNRLVAKFAIPRAPAHFWGNDFSAIPKTALYPHGDQMLELCAGIREEVQRTREPSASVGDFLVEWSELEQWLLERARQLTERNVSLGKAIGIVARREELPEKV